MPRLTLLCATALTLFAPALAHAVTIQTSLASFTAAVGASGIGTTSALGIIDFTGATTVSKLTLTNGVTIALSGSSDVIDQPGVGVGPFTNGYTGQVVDSTTNTETLTFSRSVSSFGFTLAPDVGLFGPTPVTITVTLGDGTTTSLTNSYASGDTQFIGFSGGPENSLTVSTSAPDFAFGQFLTVPEPASALLLGTALIPLIRRRRFSAQA